MKVWQLDGTTADVVLPEPFWTGWFEAWDSTHVSNLYVTKRGRRFIKYFTTDSARCRGDRGDIILEVSEHEFDALIKRIEESK